MTRTHVTRGARTALAALGVSMILLPSDTAAQAARDALLTSIDELADRLDDPSLVLLHVGREEEYASEHIPGARFIDLGRISAQEDHDGGTALSLEMPGPEALAATLESLGIGDDSRVVVYYGNDWVTPATRVLLTLDWIGLGDRSSLLDGGMQQWKAAGHPVTSEAPAPARPGSLTPRVRSELIVESGWVHAHLDDPSVRIIDARAPVHYDGIQATFFHREPVRKGHIPGAGSVPYNSLFDDQLGLRPAEELERIFADAGLEPGQTVVGYCHLGQFATAMLFAARTLGYPVKLYDGSFQEWGRLEALPVEGPGAER